MPNSPLVGIDALGNIHRLLTGNETAPGIAGPLAVNTGTGKLIGYESGVAQTTSLTAAAGSNTISGAGVPAGKIWIIDSVSAIDINSAITSLLLEINNAGTVFALTQVGAVAANVFVAIATGPWVLSAGEFMAANFGGCTLNDNLRLRVHGYQATAP